MVGYEMWRVVVVCFIGIDCRGVVLIRVVDIMRVRWMGKGVMI
jgi:hypothetical protein